MANNPDLRRVSSAVGDYLKGIYLLGGADPVSTKDLAARLEISPASVSGMLVRLHEDGLVHHQPYHGVSLTPEGLGQALRLLRRHRLIEAYLVEKLGYSWAEVHPEAEVLEHAVSDRFVESLDAQLGHPTHDPHGDPIPTSAGRLPATPDTHLSKVPAGARFRVSRLDTQDPERLMELAALGLVPGQELEVLDPSKGGSVRIRTAGRARRLDTEIAALVLGEMVSAGSG